MGNFHLVSLKPPKKGTLKATQTHTDTQTHDARRQTDRQTDRQTQLGKHEDDCTSSRPQPRSKAEALDKKKQVAAASVSTWRTRHVSTSVGSQSWGKMVGFLLASL